MEVHIKLDLPEKLTKPLGIDDDTIVESYIDSNSLHINIYAKDRIFIIEWAVSFFRFPVGFYKRQKSIFEIHRTSPVMLFGYGIEEAMIQGIPTWKLVMIV